MATKYMWILDNGHASSTPGKRSPLLDDGRQLLEYEFNRDIVARIATKLSDAGMSYFIVTPESDEDISLTIRAGRANNLKTELIKRFISVHGNAMGMGSTWEPASGIETFHAPGSVNGKNMAAVFQRKLTEHTEWKNRGVKSGDYTILQKTSMPAIITENGFYTNKTECLLMLDEGWREKIAEAHFQAILELENQNQD